MIFLGGSLEFFGNQTFTKAYRYAAMAGMNQGISNALVSANTIYVLAASYLLFREKPSAI